MRQVSTDKLVLVHYEQSEHCSVWALDGGVAKCPMCRMALPPAEHANRGLSSEQGIAALPAACRHCGGAVHFETG